MLLEMRLCHLYLPSDATPFIYFVCRLTAEFENQMHITLNETAKVVSVIVPMQCFAVCEGQTFKVMFQHELQSTKVGENLLLTPAIGKH